MHQTITQEDVIRYAYGETSAEEQLRIEEALASNPELQDFFALLKQAAVEMNGIRMTPHPTSVRIIMEESQDSSMEISNG
ncbi:MAG: hypothetical protein RLZZ370_452 [Bacteroidota bacterium]|jgi:hypothetical protein